MGDSGQRGVQPHELANVVLAALRRWPSRDGKRYAMSLLVGTIGAAHDGYRPNGVVLCSLMRNAVIRIWRGDSTVDPHFADPYDYVEVDTYLPGGANQLPSASSLEGVRLLALGSSFPEDAAAAPASAPQGPRRLPVPRRPVGVRPRSSSSRAEFCEDDDGVGGSPAVPLDPMAPPVAPLGARSPSSAVARERDPARGVRVGEAAHPGLRDGGGSRVADFCPGLVRRGLALPGRSARGCPRWPVLRRLRVLSARRVRARRPAMARRPGRAARGVDSSPGRMPHLAGRRVLPARWARRAVLRRHRVLAERQARWAELRRHRVLPARRARRGVLRRHRVLPARRAWAGRATAWRRLGRAACGGSPGRLPHLAIDAGPEAAGRAACGVDSSPGRLPTTRGLGVTVGDSPRLWVSESGRPPARGPGPWPCAGHPAQAPRGCAGPGGLQVVGGLRRA